MNKKQIIQGENKHKIPPDIYNELGWRYNKIILNKNGNFKTSLIFVFHLKALN